MDHCTKVMGWSCGNLKGKLGAVVTAHVLAGEGDPLNGMERVARTVQTKRREEGAPKKKLPVGPAEIEVAKSLAKERGLGEADQAVLDLALSLGFTFMLRGGEFLWRDGRGWDEPKVLRGRDVEIRKGATKEQDQVWLTWREAKADQLGRGHVGSRDRASGHSLCPVAALEHFQELFPERAPGGAEQDQPLMRWADGTPLVRSWLRDLLGQAAVRMGLPRDRVGVHSLRGAGATTLWVFSKRNAQLVKWMGRWSSDAYESYAWDLPEMNVGMTTGMVNAKTTVPWSTIHGRVTV